jgi:hypothetical protein
MCSDELAINLRRLGLAYRPDMVSCNMQKQQVTFADGAVRQVVERYSRVMGYHRPVNYFNPGKRQEHADRVLFREPSLA